jgi:hypothetical protein
MASKAKARARRAVDIREMLEQRARAILRRRSRHGKPRDYINNTLDKQAILRARALPLQTPMQAALAQVQMSEMPMGFVLTDPEEE